MPRYFFHTEDGACIPDREGTELPDLEAAKREALRYVGEMLGESAQFWRSERFSLTVGTTPDPAHPIYEIEVRGRDIAPGSGPTQPPV